LRRRQWWSGPRLGFELDAKIVRQDARACARWRHSNRIARTGDKQNVPIPAEGTLWTIARHVVCLVLGEAASPRNTSTA
jgi:hypothetical protein